jgi:hypothetical protein
LGRLGEILWESVANWATAAPSIKKTAPTVIQRDDFSAKRAVPLMAATTDCDCITMAAEVGEVFFWAKAWQT